VAAGNPFRHMVDAYAALLRSGASISANTSLPPLSPPSVGATAERSTALLFSPHPDDECITGALPLRLRREGGMRVVDVAVTLGSDRGRRSARCRELERACAYLGFELRLPVPGGLERIHPAHRNDDATAWAAAVAVVAELVAAEDPAVVFLPHERDGHPTHIGTSLLLQDALRALAGRADPLIVETEYWAAMARPNLMVASGADDVADLVAALSLHAFEVARNPYHLRLPAWMIDNVRRGAELIGGPGAAAPAFAFATLYRVSRLIEGGLRPLAAAVVTEDADDLARWWEAIGWRTGPQVVGAAGIEPATPAV
jgi:N-acetylglucosamine malate deacetylase 1